MTALADRAVGAARTRHPRGVTWFSPSHKLAQTRSAGFPGPALLQGSAPVDVIRRILDPTSFEDLCALVTPDSLSAIAGDQRVAACQAMRLCCCRWTLPSQPPPTVDSAVIPPISCPAQAPPGRPAFGRRATGSRRRRSVRRNRGGSDLGGT